MSKIKKTSIGGQAVMEGIMMRGPEKSSLAVRMPDGQIDLETWQNKKVTAWYKKTPFVRGIFQFIDTLRLGYSCLMKSSEKSGMYEGEPDKLELWLQKHFGTKASAVLMGIATVIGVALALFLFIFLPALVVKGINILVPLGALSNLVEGAIKITLLVTYMAAVSNMKEIHRMFAYHGAEHKTIFAYEAGDELTIENIRKNSRFHPRCGTSFILITLVISVITASFITWGNLLLRTAIKVLLLPVVVGIAYEIIKLAGRYQNICTKIISAPGLWLQRITTKEPDDDQIEVALAAFLAVISQEEGSDQW